jgi:hypothetical protein
MPHIPGVVSAGIPEATRLAQAVIHRGAEAGIVVVAGDRADRIHAERLPEAGAGERVSERERREQERRQRRRRGRRDGSPARDADDPAGGIIDIQV